MAIQLILKGTVQGVCCRAYCKEYAVKLRIRGAATNLRDGSVRVLLQTEDSDSIERYIDCLKTNPYSFRFWGDITEIEQSPFDGPIRGDYVF